MGKHWGLVCFLSALPVTKVESPGKWLSSSFICEHNELISFQGLKAAVLKLNLASNTCHTYQVPHHTSSAWLVTSPGPVHWKGLPEIMQCSFPQVKNKQGGTLPLRIPPL